MNNYIIEVSDKLQQLATEKVMVEQGFIREITETSKRKIYSIQCTDDTEFAFLNTLVGREMVELAAQEFTRRLIKDEV